MTIARSGATATLLANGDVLISGGGTKTAELYNPTNGFAATGSMSEVRSGHTATLLTDGTVLIAGPDVTAEVYNPASKMFTPVGILPLAVNNSNIVPRVIGSTASLRNDGTVLVAGGHETIYKTFPLSLASAELYALQSEGFTLTGSLNTARDGHTATVLGDGTVLVTGGINHWVQYMGLYRPHAVVTVLSSAELFK
jgi:hypothetical protein